MTCIHTLLRAFVSCCLLAASPVLLHCGEAAELGTETGNPPGILQQKLYLEITADGVRVAAGAGAITPGGAAVVVTNLTTGTKVSDNAEVDGSLDVVVAGAPGDEYEVTVVSGGQQISERVSFAQIAQGSELGGLSCGALEDTLVQNLNELFASADTACAVDADCTLTSWGAGSECYNDCGVAVLSQQGSRDAQALGADRTAPLCEALQACDRPAPSSCGGGWPFQFALCREGRCEGFDPSTASCEVRLQAAYSRYGQPARRRRPELLRRRRLCAGADPHPLRGRLRGDLERRRVRRSGAGKQHRDRRRSGHLPGPARRRLPHPDGGLRRSDRHAQRPL